MAGLLLAMSIVAPAGAQSVQARVQSAGEALAQDAAEYALLQGVPLDEAMRRLRAQEESVAFTDALAVRHRHRLAGIAIEHHPQWRIVVLLTGDTPVPDEAIQAGGMAVPIVYRTGAAATREEILEAIGAHRERIVAELPGAGMGVDPRTGSLALTVRGAGRDEGWWAAKEAELARVTGVPVTIRRSEAVTEDAAMHGGARLEGLEPADGRRYACTTGFVVTDGSRTGIVTAAHCPDQLTYSDPSGQRVPLDFLGQWGARFQDVQVHVGGLAEQPLFFVDTDKTRARTLTGWRNRHSTRAGDAVCHRGERTGYSCALVELVDYAPPAPLCAGPCDPSWVTVAGPSCRGGDSGGPIFSGTTAFGIVKGGSYRRDGSCSFYFYMSTDYLPDGWTLLHAGSALARPKGETKVSPTTLASSASTRPSLRPQTPSR